MQNARRGHYDLARYPDGYRSSRGSAELAQAI